MNRSVAAFLVFFLPFQARAQVVINELHPNPDGLDDDNEWVEIFNAGAASVDLSGWAIEDAATIDNASIRRRIPEDFDAAFGTSAILQPGDFRVVRGTGTWGAPYLNNTGGDTVYLVSNRTGNLNAVEYFLSYPSAPSGSCWANLPDAAEPAQFDWRTCTPGESNCAADVVPPAVVSDLAAMTGAYAGEVDLTWSCVGNDGNSGVALLQVVKYNTVPITELNFAASADAFNEPLPGTPGSPQAMTVFGLVPGQTYWFAVKTQDCHNTSALSSSVPQAQAGTVPLPYADHTAGLQIYFGNLHAHTGYSDGVLGSTPSDAYAYARFQAQTPLDFFAVTDHNHGSAGPMTPALYQQGLAQAAAATVDGQFVAIYGQEWGLSMAGHVNIFESPVLFGWEPGRYDVFVAQDDYASLYTAIAANPSSWGALASFCHPQNGNFDDLSFTADGAVVMCGMALVNGPAQSAAADESDVGNTNFDPQYLTALRRGFFVGPVGDQDNHEATWGASTQSRTAILATALTKDALLEALAARRTYATQDHNAHVAMAVNGWPMGSRFLAQVGSGVDFDVDVSDPDGESVQLFELFRGMQGASDPVRVATAENVDRFVHRDSESPAPVDGETRLYFLRITQTDNHRIWTAPVEVTFSTSVDVAENGAPPALGGRLYGATPNPFNPGTRLHFELLGAGWRDVSLRIFDVRGRLVRTVLSEPLDAGPHVALWDGTSDTGMHVASGIYVARLTAPGVAAHTRLVLLR